MPIVLVCVPISFPAASGDLARTEPFFYLPLLCLPYSISYKSYYICLLFLTPESTSPSPLSLPLLKPSVSLTCLYSGLLTGLPAVHLLQSLHPVLSESHFWKSEGLQIFSLIFKALPKQLSIYLVDALLLAYLYSSQIKNISCSVMSP